MLTAAHCAKVSPLTCPYTLNIVQLNLTIFVHSKYCSTEPTNIRILNIVLLNQPTLVRDKGSLKIKDNCKNFIYKITIINGHLKRKVKVTKGSTKLSVTDGQFTF